MKKTIHSLIFLFAFFVICHASHAQIFGNTVNTGYGSYGNNQIVWLKIITGPTDSGNFTHYGLYDHPTQGATCDVRYAVYDHHPTANRPNNLLSIDYDPAPINGVWNEKVMDPQVPIAANTSYWIGLRFSCNYGSGREVGVNWANQPLKYYESYSVFSPWPDPAGVGSTYGAVNNVALYLVGNNQTLPVELLSFDLLSKGNVAKLTWKTAMEINNAGWYIQRSSNGFTWENVIWVEGNINTNNVTNYKYDDILEKQGLTFYRLEQVDLDGGKSYTEVKKVDYTIDNVSVYPNPTTDQLYVNGTEGNIAYKLFSGYGVQLSDGIKLENEPIDVSNLSSGIYFIEVNNKPYRFVKK